MPVAILEKTKKHLIIKIPIDFVEKKQTEVDLAIAEGLEDIEKRRVFGPFSGIKEFRTKIKKLTKSHKL